MTVRAFLSHSSTDKRLVSEVAQQLGRAAVLFDLFEFSAGDEFSDAILHALEKSQIFVLFASKESIHRDWVKFEIDEAKKALTLGALSQCVCYIVDKGVTHSELPAWMQTTLITYQDSSSLIALDIRRLISRKIADRRPTFFVDRSEEAEAALEIITSYENPKFRPPLTVFGLDGIGRRSLVQHIAANNLSYPKILVTDIKDGDTLCETLLYLSSTLHPMAIIDPEQFIIDQQARDQFLVIDDIIQISRGICDSGTLPVFLDRGGMLDDDARFTAPFDALYNAIATEISIDAIFITNRRVRAPDGSPIKGVRVSELSPAFTERLLRLIAGRRGFNLRPGEVQQLAVYSRRYPPAAVFAIDEIEIYGLPHVLANQSALVNFSANIFIKQLANNDKIDSAMTEILRLLSNYSPLPLSVIHRYVRRVDLDKLMEALTYLVDSALVVPAGLNHAISEPVRDAAYRVFNGLRLDHGRVAELIEEYLREDDTDEARLTLGQSLFRATLLSGRKHSSYAVGLASDLIQLTTQSYHDQEYDNAIKFGKQAMALRPSSVNLRRYFAQALIRREHYDEAQEHIDALRDQGHLTDSFYVAGFMARRRRSYPKAIDFYKKAIEYGRGGVAVYRELAVCYFETGDVDAAEENIRKAESVDPLNRFVVDLRCTIAIRMGDLGAAEKLLAILERADPGGYYLHRRSVYEQALGHQEPALDYAKRAEEAFTRPPFEVLANLANAQIEVGALNDAGLTLSTLQTRFPTINQDTKIGLRCKLEIRRGDLDTAQALWEQIREKRTPVHLGLRIAMLTRKSQAKSLTPDEAGELERLSLELTEANWERSARLFGSLITSVE